MYVDKSAILDEYDSPIAGLLDSDQSRAELPAIRKALHDFYIIAKSHCGDMRFLMVTGVSKFAKTSIFSAFNNPKDLTLDARTADLLGYTHEEMETRFREHIQAFADGGRCRLMYERMLGSPWEEVRATLESMFADKLPESVRPEDLKEWLDDYDENAKGDWRGAGEYRASQAIRAAMRLFSGAYKRKYPFPEVDCPRFVVPVLSPRFVCPSVLSPCAGDIGCVNESF